MRRLMRNSMPTRPLNAVLTGQRLPALDGLRGLAVMLVLGWHFGIEVPGGLAVTALFVLSGFVITWLLLAEHDAAGSVSLPAFYVRRGLRIFPAYYVFLVFSLGTDWIRGDTRSTPAIVPAFTYSMNYFNALHGHPSSSIGHAWSLGVEQQFYIVWPLAFVALAAYGSRVLAGGLAFAIAGVAAWRSFAYLSLGLGSAYAWNAFDCRFDGLAAGCLLAVASRSVPFRSAMETCARMAGNAGLIAAVALLPVIDGAGGRYRYSVGLTIEALLIAFAIAQLLILHTQMPWRALDSSVMRYLGRVSYGIYLYHPWGLGVGHRVAGSSRWSEAAVGLAVSVVFATVSHYAIERPFLSLKTRFSRRPVASAAPAPAPERPQPLIAVPTT